MKRNKILTKNYIVGLIWGAIGARIFAEGIVLLTSTIGGRIKYGMLMYKNGLCNITDAVFYAFGELIALSVIIIGICIVYTAAIKADISIINNNR